MTSHVIVALYSRRHCAECDCVGEHKLIAEHPRAQYQCRNCNAVNEQAKPDELAPDPVDAAVERARQERAAKGEPSNGHAEPPMPAVQPEAPGDATTAEQLRELLTMAQRQLGRWREVARAGLVKAEWRLPEAGDVGLLEDLKSWFDSRLTYAQEKAERDAAERDLAQLRERLEACERERDKAQADYQFMVDRAANEKLDGYRELGQRAASAENDRDRMRQERDAAERQLEELTALVAPLGVREDEQAPVRRDERVKLHHWLARHQREREGAPSAVERELAARDAELAKALEERDHYRADRDRLQALAARPGDALREAASAVVCAMEPYEGDEPEEVEGAWKALRSALAASPSSARQGVDECGHPSFARYEASLCTRCNELFLGPEIPGDEGRWSASTKPRISLATTDARLDVIERWIEARDARAAALRAGADERKDSDQ